jgi:hypothetical protein
MRAHYSTTGQPTSTRAVPAVVAGPVRGTVPALFLGTLSVGVAVWWASAPTGAPLWMQIAASGLAIGVAVAVLFLTSGGAGARRGRLKSSPSWGSPAAVQRASAVPTLQATVVVDNGDRSTGTSSEPFGPTDRRAMLLHVHSLEMALEAQNASMEQLRRTLEEQAEEDRSRDRERVALTVRALRQLMDDPRELDTATRIEAALVRLGAPLTFTRPPLAAAAPDRHPAAADAAVPCSVVRAQAGRARQLHSVEPAPEPAPEPAHEPAPEPAHEPAEADQATRPMSQALAGSAASDVVLPVPPPPPVRHRPTRRRMLRRSAA